MEDIPFHEESLGCFDDSMVEDVVLYPAGGGFNKFRKQQNFLDSLLMKHWYGYTQTSINLKKEYVITNIIAPIHNSGRQIKIYNPNHLYNGEPEYVIPNTDVAFERIAQKLRDVKKSLTAKDQKKKNQENIKAKATRCLKKKSVATKCKRKKKTVAPISKKELAPVLHLRSSRSNFKPGDDENNNIKEPFDSTFIPPISSTSSLLSNGRNVSKSAFTKCTNKISADANKNNKTCSYERRNDDEDYMNSSDTDNDINSEAGSFINEMTISSSSTVNHQNGRKRRQPDRDCKDKTKGSANSGSRGNDNLSMNELKEIIYSQWDQIDCWRRLCCQYKETYHIQREVIACQDKLLLGVSTISPSTLGISKSTSLPGCSMNSNRHLSIPCLSPLTVFADNKETHQDQNHMDEAVAIKSSPKIQNMIGEEHEEANVNVCEV